MTDHPVSAAPRSRLRAATRWIARIAGGLVALLLLVVAGAYALSERRLRAHYDRPTHAALAVVTDSAALAQGQRLVVTRGCTDCHGADLGGRVLLDDPMLGRFVSPNLTTGPGGWGSVLTPADWESAVRHGVRRDGTSEFLMPSEDFQRLSDVDMAAIIAYARTVPAVSRVTPSNRLGPFGRLLFVAGQLPAASAERVDQRYPHTASVAAGPTAEYGAYLATSCTGCHTAQFTGGPVPGSPPGARPAANITPDSTAGIGKWSEADFAHALRTGRRPNGTAIDSTQMPIAMTRALTNTEIEAIYRYLRTIRAQRVVAMGALSFMSPM